MNNNKYIYKYIYCYYNIMEPIIITSSFLFGREVMSQTLTNSTKSILNSVKSILDDEDFYFKKILIEYDLISKVKIINSYISNITLNKELFENETIRLSIKNVNNILETIENEIKTIKIKIEEHRLLWFHKFRTPTYKYFLIELERHIKILDQRFELLIKIKN